VTTASEYRNQTHSETEKRSNNCFRDLLSPYHTIPRPFEGRSAFAVNALAVLLCCKIKIVSAFRFETGLQEG